MGGGSLDGDDSLIGFGGVFWFWIWIWLHAVNRSMSLGLPFFYLPCCGVVEAQLAFWTREDSV